MERPLVCYSKMRSSSRSILHHNLYLRLWALEKLSTWVWIVFYLEVRKNSKLTSSMLLIHRLSLLQSWMIAKCSYFNIWIVLTVKARSLKIANHIFQRKVRWHLIIIIKEQPVLQGQDRYHQLSKVYHLHLTLAEGLMSTIIITGQQNQKIMLTTQILGIPPNQFASNELRYV